MKECFENGALPSLVDLLNAKINYELSKSAMEATQIKIDLSSTIMDSRVSDNEIQTSAINNVCEHWEELGWFCSVRYYRSLMDRYTMILHKNKIKRVYYWNEYKYGDNNVKSPEYYTFASDFKFIVPGHSFENREDAVKNGESWIREMKEFNARLLINNNDNNVDRSLLKWLSISLLAISAIFALVVYIYKCI